MSRPKNKEELIALSEENFNKLNALVDSFPKDKQTVEFQPGTMNRNIRDVLAHLHHWHLMMLEWYRVGMNGKKPDMPAKGYSWKTVPELNREIWEKYRSAGLNQMRTDFNGTFKEVQKLIRKHTDEELFEKKRYPWTGSTSLGAYLISATSSHYDWAIKLIKKGMKQISA